MVPEITTGSDGKKYGDKPIYGKRYFLGNSIKGEKIPAYYFGKNGGYFIFFSSKEELGKPISCYKCRRGEPLINNELEGVEGVFKISSRRRVTNPLEKEFISQRIKKYNLEESL